MEFNREALSDLVNRIKEYTDNMHKYILKKDNEESLFRIGQLCDIAAELAISIDSFKDVLSHITPDLIEEGFKETKETYNVDFDVKKIEPEIYVTDKWELTAKGFQPMHVCLQEDHAIYLCSGERDQFVFSTEQMGIEIRDWATGHF